MPRFSPTSHPTYDPADSVVRVRALCHPAGLNGVDLDIRPGEVVALSGPSADLVILALAGALGGVSGTVRVPHATVLTEAGTPRWERLLSNNPELVLADRSARADEATRRGFLRELRRTALAHDTAVLFLTDDPAGSGETTTYADRTLFLSQGRIVDDIQLRNHPLSTENVEENSAPSRSMRHALAG